MILQGTVSCDWGLAFQLDSPLLYYNIAVLSASGTLLATQTTQERLVVPGLPVGQYYLDAIFSRPDLPDSHCLHCPRDTANDTMGTEVICGPARRLTVAVAPSCH